MDLPRRMASLPYLRSPDSIDDAGKETRSSSTSEVTVCSCQQSSKRRWNKRVSSSAMNLNTSTLLVMIIMPIFLSYFACCVSAWPMLNHRRSFSYALPVLPDYDLDVNQWALASQPVVPAAASVPDTYYDLPALNQDIYDDGLYEDPEDAYQLPYFGSIVDSEPEEELELEELKHQKPYVYEKRRPSKGKAEASFSPSSSSQPKASITPSAASPTESTPSVKASTTASITNNARKHPVLAPLGVANGQKEVAMLRPPQAAKPHHISIEEPEEPKISVAQRSPSNEKPSAYDRLRKYLSLDDALKKEYQQRKAKAMNRHTKRESVPSIITESDNLTGQLNSLKKKID